MVFQKTLKKIHSEPLRKAMIFFCFHRKIQQDKSQSVIQFSHSAFSAFPR